MKPAILIVGAGPTGLVLALWLTRYGIPVRIIDKNAEPGSESRAIGVQARTLEFYQQMGFAAEIIERGMKADTLNIRKNKQRKFSIPLKDMGKGLSPFPFILFYPQDDHEKVLIEHLHKAGVDVERNTELTDFMQTTEGVDITLKTEKGLEKMKVDYLCGCDGARSTVRELLHIPFPGGTYSQIFYVADVLATNESNNNELQICVNDADFCIILPIRHRGSFRLIGTVPPDKLSQQTITFNDVIPSVLRNISLDIKSLNWFSTYHVHHRVAQQFRNERVFLIGDAAHIHSPAGAQGMNTGIGDAINLAWKLAAVLNHQAPLSLLDTYELERIPFAKKLVATTDNLFRLMTNPGLPGKFWRDFLLPYILPNLFRLSFIKHFFFKLTSQIQINYHKSPLSKGHAGKIKGGDRLPWVAYETSDNFASLQSMDWQIHIYGEADTTQLKTLNLPCHIFPWDENAEQAGLKKDTLYLIRPDGYIAFIGSVQNSQGLDDFLHSIMLSLSS